MLLDGIANLPEAHVKIITLHYFKDIPVPEVAKTLGLPLQQVQKMHHDAMIRLKLFVK